MPERKTLVGREIVGLTWAEYEAVNVDLEGLAPIVRRREDGQLVIVDAAELEFIDEDAVAIMVDGDKIVPVSLFIADLDVDEIGDEDAWMSRADLCKEPEMQGLGDPENGWDGHGDFEK